MSTPNWMPEAYRHSSEEPLSMSQLQGPDAHENNYEHLPGGQWYGEGGCGHLALAFKNLFPEMKIAANWDRTGRINEDGEEEWMLNHAAAYDPQRGLAFDSVGTHDPHVAVSGHRGDIDLDVDPADIAWHRGIRWTPEDPWDDMDVHSAERFIRENFLPQRTSRYLANAELDFTTGGDVVGQEYHGYIAALMNGRQVGRLDYTYYQNELGIRMIQVEPEYQRQGIADALLARLKAEDPGVPVFSQGGFNTEQGQSWLDKNGIRMWSKVVNLASWHEAGWTPPPQFYHWTEAHTAPQVQKGVDNGLYLTLSGGDPKTHQWNPEIHWMYRPTRLTIDTSKLDPNLFEADTESMRGYEPELDDEEGWEDRYGPEDSLETTENVYYNGQIPPEAIVESQEFEPSPTWRMHTEDPTSHGYDENGEIIPEGPQYKWSGRFAEYDYRMNHQAPGPDDAPIHDLEQVAPDIYSHPEYYTTREPEFDSQSVSAFQAARGNPEAMITIHRAAPVRTINPGDWVTTSHAYAKQHSKHPTDPTQDMRIWSAKVPASSLFWNGDSIHEYGYHGPPLEGKRFHNTRSNPELRDMSQELEAIRRGPQSSWREAHAPNRGHVNISTGQPCQCTFFKWPRLPGMEYIAGKLEWLQGRPDMQTPEGQDLLAFMKEMMGNPTVGDKLDPLLPWIAREIKKGRIQYKPDSRWKGMGYLTIPNAEGGRQSITQGELSHLADWFRDKRAPNRQGLDIMQHTYPEVKQKTQEWDDWMKEQRAQADAKNAAGAPVAHEFDNGWTLRQLRPEDLKYEGDAMGHCVGSYSNEVANGNSLVYSLRDPKHEPHATVEIEPQGRFIHPDFPHSLNSAEADAAEMNSGRADVVARVAPHQGRIVQIQGKGNEVPNPEYQQMLKEWFGTFPDEERPFWQGDQITTPDELYGEEDDRGAYGAGGMGGYGPHGDYGVMDRSEIDYPSLLENSLPDGDYSHMRPASAKEIYSAALKRGEIPQLAEGLEPFTYRQQESFDEWRDMNYDDRSIRLPDEDDEYPLRLPNGYGFDSYEDHEKAYYDEEEEWAREHPGMQMTTELYRYLYPHLQSNPEGGQSYVNELQADPTAHVRNEYPGLWSGWSHPAQRQWDDAQLQQPVVSRWVQRRS